jgi:hypothetical protein
MNSSVDLDLEPINPHLRDCITEELARLPGSRLVKRRGRLFYQGLNGFEIAAEVLCAAKARWAELQQSGATITDEQIWDFLVLLIGGDVRLREIPGVGYSLDLPPSHHSRQVGGSDPRNKLNGHAASNSAPA